MPKKKALVLYGDHRLTLGGIKDFWGDLEDTEVEYMAISDFLAAKKDGSLTEEKYDFLYVDAHGDNWEPGPDGKTNGHEHHVSIRNGRSLKTLSLLKAIAESGISTNVGVFSCHSGGVINDIGLELARNSADAELLRTLNVVSFGGSQGEIQNDVPYVRDIASLLINHLEHMESADALIKLLSTYPDSISFSAKGRTALLGSLEIDKSTGEVAFKRKLKHNFTSTGWPDDYEEMAVDFHRGELEKVLEAIASIAMTEQDIKLFRFLFENDFTPDFVANNGWSFLKHASYSGSYDIVMLLLNQGCSLRKFGQEALLGAVKKGHEYIVQQLIIEMRVESLDLGEGLLCHAAIYDKEEVASVLLKYDVDPFETINGHNAFVYACVEGHYKIADMILDKHPEILDSPSKEGVTPLAYAVETGNYYMAKWLLDHDADVHQVNATGDSLLHIESKSASNTTNTKMLKLLLDVGIDFNATDAHGQSALFYVLSSNAFWNQKEAKLKLLLEHGVDINAKNNKDESLLSRACQQRDIQAIKLLLQYGANPHGVRSLVNPKSKVHTLLGTALDMDHNLHKAAVEIKDCLGILKEALLQMQRECVHDEAAEERGEVDEDIQASANAAEIEIPEISRIKDMLREHMYSSKRNFDYTHDNVKSLVEEFAKKCMKGFEREVTEQFGSEEQGYVLESHLQKVPYYLNRALGAKSEISPSRM